MHAWDQPAEVLYARAPALDVPLLMPQLGEPIEPAHGLAPKPWWRAVDGAARGRQLPTPPPQLPLPKSVHFPLD